MADPIWTRLASLSIKAKPDDGVWQLALSYISGPAILKVEATGQWSYSTTIPNECSANGDLSSPLDSKKCIHQNAAVGALVGRIGGSIADKDSTSVFVIGSFCIRRLDKDAKGPLFLAINDLWTGFADNAGELKVTMDIASDAD